MMVLIFNAHILAAWAVNNICHRIQGLLQHQILPALEGLWSQKVLQKTRRNWFSATQKYNTHQATNLIVVQQFIKPTTYIRYTTHQTD
jgi:hypothetical protein